MATHLDLEEQEQLDELKHFWNKWGTPITAVLAVVVGGFAVWNGYQYWQARQAQQAAALSDAVQVAVQSGDQARIAQAFDSLKSQYGSTQQAGQAALLVAKSALDTGKLEQAKPALQWAAEHAADEGYKSTARLRLAGLLMQDKDYDAAAKLLQAGFPAEFEGLAADRRGDLLKLQGKDSEAIAAYQQAWKLLDQQVDYRTLVGFKLNALGVSTEATAQLVPTETKK